MDPATGRPPPRRPLLVETTDGVGLLTVEEAIDPRNWGSAEPSRQSPEAPREQRRSRRRRHRRPYFPPPLPPSRSLPPVDDGAAVSSVRGPSRGAGGYMLQGGARGRRRLIRDVTSSVASSSSAPSRSHSDHPGTGTRVRQSVLYSDRSSRSRHRRAAQDVPVLPTIDAFSLSDPPLLTPQIETGERSDGDYDGAEQYTCEESSSELGRSAIDLPTIEPLSLSDPPLLTSQIAEESADEYPVQPESVVYRIRTVGPRTLHYSVRPPRPQWLGGIRGQAIFEEHAGDASSNELGSTVTVPSRSEALSLGDSSFIPQSIEVKPTKDSDADKEESLRLLREYYLKNPPTSLEQAFDEILAVERSTRAARAAERGMPTPRRKPCPIDQETHSLRAEEHASAAAAQPESITPRQQIQESSMEEIIENGKRWMCDEVMICFRKYAERRRSKIKILESHLDELCHQCFNVEDYNKVFHHYNFKVKMRKPDSADWTVSLYFAEVKEIFGRKYYFCCPLEPNENGHCYACMKQGVEDLKHPATGGFETGFIDATLFGYAEE